VPVPRLDDASRVALLVVDVQERLVPEMERAERLVARCRFLVETAGVLGWSVLATEQYVRGLGRTVPVLRDALETADAFIEDKTRFSGCTDGIVRHLRERTAGQVVLAGIEAHVCVLQSGLDLLERGFEVFLASDAVSAGEPDQIEPARRRLEQAGAVPSGCVSLAYEAVRDASDPRFRDLLPLVKTLRSGRSG